jgi:hypothetical protein
LELADKGNRWVNHKYNFDNLGQALMSLFVLSSKDGWVSIMYQGLDAVGPDQQVSLHKNFIFVSKSNKKLYFWLVICENFLFFSFLKGFFVGFPHLATNIFYIFPLFFPYFSLSLPEN